MTPAEDKLLELHDLIVLIVNERISDYSLREDALQEALLAAWTRLEQGHGHGIAVHAAKQATVSVARGHRMTGSKSKGGTGGAITRTTPLVQPGSSGSEEYLIEPADISAQAAYDEVDARASLETLLAPLSDEQRSLVLLRLEGLTTREIAPQLGVSHQGVSYRLTKALGIIRNHIEEQGRAA